MSGFYFCLRSFVFRETANFVADSHSEDLCSICGILCASIANNEHTQMVVVSQQRPYDGPFIHCCPSREIRHMTDVIINVLRMKRRLNFHRLQLFLGSHFLRVNVHLACWSERTTIWWRKGTWPSIMNIVVDIECGVRCWKVKWSRNVFWFNFQFDFVFSLLPFDRCR